MKTTIITITSLFIITIAVFITKLTNIFEDYSNAAVSVVTYGSTYIKSTSNIDKDISELFKKELTQQNEAVVNSFIKDGGTFSLTTEKEINKISNTDSNSNYIITGRYAFKNDIPKIYIRADEMGITAALSHELGHYIDYKSEWKLSSSKEFQKIFEQEYQKSKLSEYHRDKKEYFAEMYQQYKDNNQVIKENCPKTWNYIKQIDENYSTDPREKVHGFNRGSVK